jgi:uncharacterized SAM-binding protein YcdF (DUF218 family)
MTDMKDLQSRCCWGLMRRRQRLCLTWRGRLLASLLFVAVFVGAVKSTHPFLAVSKPVEAEVLVAEGWLPDYALDAVIAEFKRQPYRKLYVTGGPIEVGGLLMEYGTYAEVGAARLRSMGFDTNRMQAVPAAWVKQDRTYTAALALKQYVQQQNAMPARMNIISDSTHARRSRLMFEKAFGDNVSIGIISIPSNSYDSARWWRSSAGVRGTLDELIAYIYARFFFHPQPPEK